MAPPPPHPLVDSLPSKEMPFWWRRGQQNFRQFDGAKDTPACQFVCGRLETPFQDNVGLQQTKVAMHLEQTRVRNNVKVLSNNQDAARLSLEKPQASETYIETVKRQMESMQVELNRIETRQTRTVRNELGQNQQLEN